MEDVFGPWPAVTPGAKLWPVHCTGNATFLDDVARTVTHDGARTTA